MECFWQGYTNLTSFFMGGISGLIIGKLNHCPKYYKLAMWEDCFIGMTIVLIVESIFGGIALYFGLRFWDYTNMPLNYKGIICLPYAIVWYIITPFCMWCEDALRWKLFDEGKYYSIFENYKDLIMLQ